MKTLHSALKSVIVLLLLICTQSTSSSAQSVLDPNDPIVVYSAANPPATPPWGQISKWVKTNRFSWNTSSFKAYYYNGVQFRLKFPKTYNPTAVDGKKYPMIVFFHGRGEPGTIYDNEYSLLHGGQQFRDKVDNGTFDGYILVPQTTNGFWSQSHFDVVRNLIDYMVTNNKLDGFHVIANGLSSGGGGTWDMTIAHPTYISGMMPMSSSSTAYTASAVVQKLKFTPSWIFQGGLDPSPAPYTTELVRDAFLNAGATFKYTLYPTLAHGTWNTAWAEPDFYPFAKRSHAANPWPLFGRSEFCPGEAINITLGLTPGFTQYEWRKNGVLISGATSNTLNVSGAAVAGNAAIGEYSARVRRGTVWSDWSPAPVTVGIKPPTTPPTIAVAGVMSKVLPALDGNSSVTLSVPAIYQSYLWQKEGSTTTISTANTVNANSPGLYKVRVTEQFGCSTEFSAPFTVISADGPNKPDAAINLVVTTLSTSSLQLNWSDNPAPQHNETNFEIYRSLTAGGPYTLVHINNADVLSYVDNNLDSKTKYYYKVRSVNNTGAAPGSNEASGTTDSDVQAPTAPSFLVVAGTTRTTVSLAWEESTDNTGVAKYDVYVNGIKSYVTTETSFTVSNLQTGQPYNFAIKARDEADNESPFSNQVTAQPILAGLPYKYYTYEGTWNNLPNFGTLTPVSIGVMPNVAITPRTQNDRFAFLWEGYIKIPVTGTYYFRTRSDDGSRLWLGSLNGISSPYVFGTNSSLVNNDGLHGAQDRTSVALNLTAGTYPIAIAFYEQSSGESMSVSWRTPQTGTSYVTIPNSAFGDDPSPMAPAPDEPSTLTATAVSYKQINLSWVDNSNNETGFEIWRSTNSSSGFTTIGIAAANATSYIDSTVTGTTTYYYQIRAIGLTGESDLVENVNPSEAVWLFDSNLTDASGNGRTLSQSNNPTYSTSDKQEGTHSIGFNGTNQSVTIPTNNSFIQNAYSQKTVAFWMKSSNNTGNRIVVDLGGSDDGLALRLDANRLYAGVASNNTRRNFFTSYTSTGWNHIALVYSGNTLRLYVNGVEAESNTNLGFSATTTTSNGSRIGGNNSSNAFNTGTAFFNGRIDHFGIYGSALSQANIVNLMNNAPLTQSFATTPALPALPGVPANLVASGVSSSKIEVTWNDVANETSYQLFRSSNNNSNFILFATLPANTTSYSDSGLFANSTNYYKIRAVNEAGNTAFSNEDSAKTANNIPVLAAIADQFMRIGTTFQVNVSATDLDPEVLTINTTNLPAFASFASSANGVGLITFTNPPSIGTFSDIGVTVTDQNGGSASLVFSLTVNDNYLPVIQPVADVNMSEQATTQVNISAADQNATDVLTWSFAGLPSFATPTINGGAVQISLAPGLADHGAYNVTATVDDGNSGVTSVSFVINVSNVNPNKKTFINFTDGSFTSPAPWNNTNKATPSLNDVFTNLLDETGSVSGIGLRVTSPWQNLGNATNTFGVVTGNNSGVYPDNVIRTAYFTTNVNQTIEISGLNPAYKYNFTFFGSRGQVNDDRTSVYTINGTSVSLNAAANSQNTVTISGAQPNAQGTLVLTLSKGAGSAYGYLNAMVVESLFDDGSAPAKPRNVTASLLPNNNVRLNWVDAAYNESAYEVYRSSTNLPGSFQLVNPGGNNANLEQYTDGTTTGNATFYYFVRALNSVGSSPNSDTVSINIPNVAPSIAPIADVIMKTEQVVNFGITTSDAPGDIVTLSATGLPAFATFTNNGNGTASVNIAPGSTTGSYNVTVTAQDNFGLSSNTQFAIIVTDKDINAYKVNFNQVLPVGTPWNSFNSAPTAGATISNITDEAGVPSGISVTLVDAWDNSNDVGAVTGTNSGVYPDNVMKTAYFTNTTTAKRIRISGLSVLPGVKYNLTLFASRGGINDVRNTIYSYGGQSVSLNAANNTSNTVQLQGIVPNASGVIEFTAQKAGASSFGYINAMVLESYVDNGLPISPINLVAAAKTTSSIQLSWTDRSNNEDGFEIYRSTTENGTYTLVTTTAANVSTYLHQGLPTGTLYYYKVRAKKTPDFSAYSNIAGSSTLQYSVYVNFNQDNPAGAPWNNTNEGPIPDDVYPNLLNSSGNPTGINMTVLGTAFNGVNPFGINTGNNSGVYPDNVISQTWWLDANTTAMLRIDGLSIASNYNFTFFASRACDGCDRTTVYTINGRSVSLNAANNSSVTATLSDITPDEDGSVVIEIRAGGASSFAYIGSVVIDAYMKATISGGGGPGATVNGGNSIVQGRIGNGTNSIVGNTATNTVSVFPNPIVSSDLSVNLSLTQATKRLDVVLRDVSGRTLYTQQLLNVPMGHSQQKLGYNTNKLQPGVYFVTVTGLPGDNQMKSVRIVKVD